MSQATKAPPRFRTVADLLQRLGDVPPERVRLHPTPGKATERDLLGPNGRLCELVEGVLVEKAMGYDESLLAMELGAILHGFVKRYRLGEVTGADGTMRLMPGLVRIPDVAFTSRKRLPKKEPRRRKTSRWRRLEAWAGARPRAGPRRARYRCCP